MTVAASAVTVYASDLFSRTLANSWGSANTGGAYTLQGTAADYDTTGTTGTIALPTGSANRSAVLASVSARDVDLSYRVAVDKVPVGGNLWSYGLVRRVNATNEYRAILRFAAGGAVFIQASTLVNNTEASIGTEVRVTGSNAAAGQLHPRALAVHRRQPDDDPHARLGRRHDRADHLAVHRHQQRGRTPGRRRRRPPRLPRQRRHQHARSSDVDDLVRDLDPRARTRRRSSTRSRSRPPRRPPARP